MNNIILISLDAILILFIFVLIFYIRLPKILPSLNEKFILCRKFVIEHEAPFNVGFILLFSIEQGLLAIYIFLFRDNIDYLKVIVSLFSLIVIATASIQAIILQTRLKYQGERYEYIKKTIPFLDKVGFLDKGEKKSKKK